MGTSAAEDRGQEETMLEGQGEDGATPRLYRHHWPPVAPARGLSEELHAFARSSPDDQRLHLQALRGALDRHEAFIHGALAELYAHCFGYRDGVATRLLDDETEIAMNTARVHLERELLERWLDVTHDPAPPSQEDAAALLEQLGDNNPGVRHALFEYLAWEAPPEHLLEFLLGEVVRNEVVDDEVALLLLGKQGLQKATIAANLWDECGRGKLERFHTYWLRRWIERSELGWSGFVQARAVQPWFAKLTSNVFAMTLLRPALRQHAFGCFIVFESWVEPHFRQILRAMDRLGMDSADERIYFTAHVAVDPRHSNELVGAVRNQIPTLDAREITSIVEGARWAVGCGQRQYDHWLKYFTDPRSHC